jgi:TPR repeat protein
MNERSGESGPVIVPTENWELYKERWYEVADLHDSGDVAGAVFQLKRLAAEGFSPALAELGDKYEFGGGGIDVDLAEAVEWYKKSVEAIDDVRSHIGLARI